MFKRIIALLLCVVMLVSVLASCDIDDLYNHETSKPTTEQPQGTTSDHTHDETKPSEGTTEEPKQHTHTPDSAVTEKFVDSTCTTTGSYDEVVYCSTCNEEISRTSKTIEKKAHDYSEKVATSVYLKAVATCNNSALYYYSCVCGDKGIATFLYGKSNGHAYHSAATAPTCIENGYTTYTCACGDTYVDDEVAALGHTFGEWEVTTEPTESTKGEKRRDCQNCDHFETDIIAELTHDHGRWEQITIPAIAPNCTTSGLTEGKKCSKCGEFSVAQETVSALGHSYNSENTCTYCKDYKDQGVVFTLSDGEYSVTDYIGNASEVIIPSSYKGYPVTSIGEYAFEYSKNLTRIIIPNTVTKIDGYAFKHCPSLSTIYIGSGVTAISLGAFDDCPNITSIIVDPNNENFKSIDGNLYTKDTNNYLMRYATGKQQSSFTVPEGVIGIAEKAFANCNSITNVVLPNSITYIAGYTFYECSQLKYINIPEGVIWIGERAFEGCKSLENIILPQSLESIGYLAFSDCDTLTSVTIPKNVSYYYESFSSCDRLEEIIVDKNNEHFVAIDGVLYTKDKKTLLQYANGRQNGDLIIPDGVTTIEDNAFRDCTTLINVTIPASVTEIKSSFYLCTKLQSFTVDENNEYFSSIDGNLYDKNATRLIKYALGKFALSFYIPESVSTINAHAFAGATSLYSVYVHKDVTNIGVCAFANSESIWINVDEDNQYYKSLDGNLYSKDGKTLIQYLSRHTSSTFVVPQGVTTINTGAFGFNQTLKKIIINNDIVILNSAFYECTNLETIVLPENTVIDYHVFYECDSLTSIYYQGSIENSENISVGSSGNAPFLFATFYYYSETAPTSDGNYWHYVNGVPTQW